MRAVKGRYWAATQHPWACVLFVAPLLACYEIGLSLVHAAPAEAQRSGADSWLRALLQSLGIAPQYGAPALLLVVLVAWALWRRGDRPREILGVWIGMAVESAAFALGLLLLSHLLLPALQTLGGLLESTLSRGVRLYLASAVTTAAAPWEQIIGYLGAGIYEETLFRLLLFSGLVAVAVFVGVPGRAGAFLSAAVSALLFAGAHNLGPEGEPFQLAVFLFRVLAGLYFTGVYYWRGFGIAVGAHAGYDVLVGFLMRVAV